MFKSSAVAIVLALDVAVLSLWIASYFCTPRWVMGAVVPPSETRRIEFLVRSGQLLVDYRSTDIEDCRAPLYIGQPAFEVGCMVIRDQWQIDANGIIEAAAPIPLMLYCLMNVPCYCIALLLGIVSLWPALVLFKWLRIRSRRHRGCCVNCGYSRQGNVTKKCPECGLEEAKVSQEEVEKGISPISRRK